MRRLLRWLAGGNVPAAHGRPAFRPEVTALEGRDVPSALGLHAGHHAVHAHLHSRYYSDLVAIRAVDPASTYTVSGYDVVGGYSVNPYDTYTMPGYDFFGPGYDGYGD